MKEIEPKDIGRHEVSQLNQSEFLAELEEARLHWIEELEEAIDKIRSIDRQRLGVDQAIIDNQVVRYFKEEKFDKNGNHIFSRLYFRPEPKGELGFQTNERNKTE
jgi:hypothetical protein